MSVTVDQLMRCSPAELTAAAGALRTAAGVVTGVGARLPCLAASSWSGAAADAATGGVEELRAVLRRLGDATLAVADALSTAASPLAAARAGLRAAVESAGASAGQLPEDGSVVDTAGAAAALVRAALAAAASADDDAVRALRRGVAMLHGAPAPLWQWPPAPGAAVLQSPVQQWLRPAAPARPMALLTFRPRVPAGAAPLDIAAWWAVQPPSQQRALLDTESELIGRLDGVPVQVRHEANSRVLARLLGDTTAGFADRAMALSVLRELRADPLRRLVTLDFADGGLAAVAAGDAASAEHVAVLVPGRGADVTHDLDGLVAEADRLRAAARDLAPATALATVAWLGYRTPKTISVVANTRAISGGRRLAAFTEGLAAARRIDRVLRTGAPALHVTLVGHSYGSLTVGHAMRRRPPAGDVVLLGSPGVAADSALALTGAPARVFVGEARGDPIADVAWFNTDPSAPAFGARVLQTDGGVDPVAGTRLRPSTGHGDYYTAGSESLRNIAAVAVGLPAAASYGDMRGAGDRVPDVFDVVRRRPRR